MSCLWKLGMSLTILLIFAVPQLSRAIGPKQSASAAHSKAAARTATFPPLWFSETTHTVYRVRIDGNILRADQANVPPEAAKHGAYVRTEVRKTGGKWIGASKIYVLLTGGQAGQPQQSNWCHLETNIEFLTLSPERITGRAEALEQVDIPKCRVLKKEWKNFVWVPAK
ncbi:MAG: hypothetical protein ACRD2G_11750 [Terriglobia bacterium]